MAIFNDDQLDKMADRLRTKSCSHRVLVTQTIVHIHEVEAPDHDLAEAVTANAFFLGQHDCRQNRCFCTPPEIIDSTLTPRTAP